MKNIVLLTAMLIPGCAAINSSVVNNNIDLVYQTKFEKAANDYYASVARFELSNRSQSTLCVSEDIFLNDLSAFVSVDKKTNDEASSSGIPNPPKSNQILRIEPGQSKSFERIIDYRGKGRTLSRKYLISVELSFCKNGRRFIERAIVG